MWSGGPDGYLRPVQFLDHLTVITNGDGKPWMDLLERFESVMEKFKNLQLEGHTDINFEVAI